LILWYLNLPQIALSQVCMRTHLSFKFLIILIYDSTFEELLKNSNNMWIVKALACDGIIDRW
jgi:hypothetical protein